jgi:hypothetical protein
MNFREKAAGFILCNDNIGEALKQLEKAEDVVPKGVIVWQPFANYLPYALIEYIDLLDEMLEEAYLKGKQDKV